MAPAGNSWEKKPKVIGTNNWKVSGKVIKKVVQGTATGGIIVKLLVNVPAKNPKYNTEVWLKAFNSKDPSKNIADQIDNAVKEGDAFYFSGSFTSSDYVGEDKKKHHAEDKVIWQFEPVAEVADDENPF